MTCDDWKAFVHDYVLGDLSDPAKALLDRHVADCASCLIEARALQAVERQLSKEPPRDVPAGLADRVMSALPQRKAPNFRGELVRMAAALLVVAGLAATATLGVVQAKTREWLPEQVQAVPGTLLKAATDIGKNLQE